jgi:hypothetical protein
MEEQEIRQVQIQLKVMPVDKVMGQILLVLVAEAAVLLRAVVVMFLEHLVQVVLVVAVLVLQVHRVLQVE